MTHTEESLMALADEYATLATRGRATMTNAEQALRFAIREVLAERDELRKMQEHCLLGMKHCPQRSRAEKVEAEREWLRKDAERLDAIENMDAINAQLEITRYPCQGERKYKPDEFGNCINCGDGSSGHTNAGYCVGSRAAIVTGQQIRGPERSEGV